MMEQNSLIELFVTGGFAMYPLLLSSLLVWGICFERLWRFRILSRELRTFHLQATNWLLRKDRDGLGRYCRENLHLPTAQLLFVALEKRGSSDVRVRKRWVEAVQRKRSGVNRSLRGGIWLMATVATASPFLGLFGTVVGILQSFADIGSSGKGGFAVVASGISEALIATAAGILVAVVAAVLYNVFTQWLGAVVLQVRNQTDELLELLPELQSDGDPQEGVPETEGGGSGT